MQVLEARLLELASDVLTSVGRGDLAADAPLVRAAAAALAELRRVPESSATRAAGAPVPATKAAGQAADRSGRAREAPPAVEQVLAVAARMRAERRSFAAACAVVAEELGTSAQAVRNACTRWLGVSAAEWQPLLVDGAQAGVLPLARRVAERCPWVVDRIGREFGVAAASLVGAPGAR